MTGVVCWCIIDLLGIMYFIECCFSAKLFMGTTASSIGSSSFFPSFPPSFRFIIKRRNKRLITLLLLHGIVRAETLLRRLVQGWRVGFGVWQGVSTDIRDPSRIYKKRNDRTSEWSRRSDRRVHFAGTDCLPSYTACRRLFSRTTEQEKTWQ